MSIRFAPYTSKYPGTKIYTFHYNRADYSTVTNVIYNTHDDVKTQKKFSLDDSKLKEFDALFAKQDGRREFILQDFAVIIKMITNTFTSSIWKTLNISPLLTRSELLWLKVDDVDGHVNHLEKILMQVMEENKLLQHRVEALEQKGILYELD